MDFHGSICLGGGSRGNVVRNIRKFAEDHCGMDKAMAELIEHIRPGRA
ncbi:MAG: hypothetical protein LBS32_01630 [Clostridiales Family XIII bacterium]|jgi:hypothetical protein|nr:hypothetical protein [Clostridiales Family XIII bacterium]